MFLSYQVKFICPLSSGLWSSSESQILRLQNYHNIPKYHNTILPKHDTILRNSINPRNFAYFLTKILSVIFTFIKHFGYQSHTLFHVSIWKTREEDLLREHSPNKKYHHNTLAKRRKRFPFGVNSPCVGGLFLPNQHPISPEITVFSLHKPLVLTTNLFTRLEKEDRFIA